MSAGITTRLLPFAALALVLSGCATADGGRRSQVTLGNAKVTQIDFAGVDLRFDLVVKNPTDRYVKLDAYRWDLLVAGKKLAKGHSSGSQPVDSSSDLVVPIEVSVKNGDVFGAMRADRLKKRPTYELRLAALIAGGLMTLPQDFEKRGELPILYRPIITLQNFHVLKQTDQSATVRFDALLENLNNFPIHLDKTTANLHLAGRPVAQEFQTKPRDIPANGRTVADYELDLDLAVLGETVVNALRQNEVSYQFDGTTAFNTPWGQKSLNFMQSGRLQIKR
ncbi:MAG: LEA type 2 family protein [Verrucomicrobia bacterium]|nr:LEA type 2 family protein [Verrucomicrobiota bacterium]